MRKEKRAEEREMQRLSQGEYFREMPETKINIRKAILTVITAAVLLSATFLYIIQLLSQTNRRETEVYMDELSEQYVSIVDRQMEGELHILSGIGAFIDSHISEEDIYEVLKTENQKNDFLRIGYADRNYQGFYINENGQLIENVDFSAYDFVRSAMEGKQTVSQVYEDVYGPKNIICFAVPVYGGGEISGVLTASNTVDFFSELINRPIFQGKGGTIMISPDGMVFAGNQEEEKQNNFLENNQFPDGEKEKIQAGMAQGEDMDISFQRNGKSYIAAMRSLAYNGWYLVCMVPVEKVNDEFRAAFFLFLAAALVLVILFSVLICYIHHITHKSRKMLNRVAYYDSLTGSYNKNGFDVAAKELLLKNQDYSLALFDVHNFKFINYSFGKEAGNALLKYISKVMGEMLRADEVFYHRHADCFGMLIHTRDKEILEARAKGIMKKISEYQVGGDENYPIYCYCGITVLQMFSETPDLDRMVDRANMAKSTVKGFQGNQLAFYDEKIYWEAERRNRIEQKMEAAFANREFQVYIQPKYDLKSEKVCAGEALVRWISKEGVMSPAEFIPVFEQNGFIVRLDMYMLEEVCRLQKKWQESGHKIYPISLNQSRLAFYQKNYVELVMNIINRFGVRPENIILEITESMAADDSKVVESVTNRLREAGVGVSMDDFGSGYSSLNLLRDLSIDELKLDRGFLMQTEHEKRNLDIMSSILQMAAKLNIRTVCEGVETPEHVNILKEMGCDVAQGFYYSAPIPAVEFEAIAF